MKAMLERFTERRLVQDLVIEVITELLMLSCGIVIGYYLKVMMI